MNSFSRLVIADQGLTEEHIAPTKQNTVPGTAGRNAVVQQLPPAESYARTVAATSASTTNILLGKNPKSPRPFRFLLLFLKITLDQALRRNNRAPAAQLKFL